MAKKSKRKKRRVGSALSLKGGKSSTMKLIGLAAGYLLADKVNDQVLKILPKKKDSAGVEVPNTQLAMVAEIGLGGYLALRSKNKMLQIGGAFVAGAGLKLALKSAGVIKGYQSVPVVGGRIRRAGGYQATPVIGGMPSQLSGLPNQLSGYRVNGNSQGSNVMGNVTQGSDLLG